MLARFPAANMYVDSQDDDILRFVFVYLLHKRSAVFPRELQDFVETGPGKDACFA